MKKRNTLILLSLSLSTSAVLAEFVTLINPVSNNYEIVETTLESEVTVPSMLNQRLIASNSGNRDYFGFDSAISGGVVISGAYGEDGFGSSAGAAYVYQYDDSNWVETKLKASDASSNDQYGRSVSISGNTVMVSSLYSGSSSYGAAYIYKNTGSDWVETKLMASTPSSTDKYATSIDVDGNIAIVGAPEDGSIILSAGAAYIYENIGSNWVETKLMASDPDTTDKFGQSVSVSGNMAVVGAYFDDEKTTNAGAVYVFEKENGSWVEKAKLMASDGGINNNFGSSVEIDGNMIIVGAPNKAPYGAGYIFVKVGDDWVEHALEIDDWSSVVRLGNDVSISNNLAIIGSSEETGVTIRSGAAYIFGFDGTNWNQEEKIEIETGTYFGQSVSISEGKAIVGTHKVSVDGDTDAGAVYVYD